MTNLQNQLESRPQLLSHESSLGAVHIAVTDPTQARTFWKQVIGLTELEPDTQNTIRLGAGNQELVVLHPNATGTVEPRRTGLYHLAIHLPNRKEFARALARLLAMRYPNSPTDHTITETTYLSDPDGNGIELTLETPERGQTVWLPNGQPTIQTSDGRFVSPVLSLDLEPIMAALEPTDDLRQPMPVGTKIGHVHLHVRDVRKATNFYRNLIGFRVLMEIPQMGMIDFGLEVNSLPHTLAINAWHGPHAAPPTPGTAGLRFFTVYVSGADLKALEARLQATNWAFETLEGGLQVLDPSGNALQVISRDNSRDKANS
jgi:catechol 2,3-dioxygenase